MNCEAIKRYLPSYIDGESDSRTAIRVREHLSACVLCSMEWEQEREMDSLLRQSISREKAPPALKEAVLDRIEEYRITSEAAQLPGFPRLRLASVALVSVVLVAGIAFAPVLVRKTRPFPIFSESISSHNKFLQGALPVEILTNNPDDIRQWFQGKLDFALTVPEFPGKGVELVGGRLCHVREREAAYLVYRKNNRYISVFIMNVGGIKIPKSRRIDFPDMTLFVKSEKGHQSILCVKKGGDVGCIFVSDLPEEELMGIIT